MVLDCNCCDNQYLDLVMTSPCQLLIFFLSFLTHGPFKLGMYWPRLQCPEHLRWQHLVQVIHATGCATLVNVLPYYGLQNLV